MFNLFQLSVAFHIETSHLIYVLYMGIVYILENIFSGSLRDHSKPEFINLENNEKLSKHLQKVLYAPCNPTLFLVSLL